MYIKIYMYILIAIPHILSVYIILHIPVPGADLEVSCIN